MKIGSNFVKELSGELQGSDSDPFVFSKAEIYHQSPKVEEQGKPNITHEQIIESLKKIPNDFEPKQQHQKDLKKHLLDKLLWLSGSKLQMLVTIIHSNVEEGIFNDKQTKKKEHHQQEEDFFGLKTSAVDGTKFKICLKLYQLREVQGLIKFLQTYIKSHITMFYKKELKPYFQEKECAKNKKLKRDSQQEIYLHFSSERFKKIGFIYFSQFFCIRKVKCHEFEEEKYERSHMKYQLGQKQQDLND